MAVSGGLRAPFFGGRGLRGVDRERIASAIFVHIGRAVPDPLPPAVHRHAHQEFDFRHFKRRAVAVAHEIADQSAIVGNFSRSLAIADAGSLHDGLIVTHHID